jgi:hypothetical protein
VTPKPRVLTALMVALLTVTVRATAAPIVFSGADPGATSATTIPNSFAAAGVFDAAAALLQPMSLLTFESLALGIINNTSIASGVQLDASGSGNGLSSITDATIAGVGCGFDLCGGNTTSEGSRWAEAAGGNFLFSFTDPIQAFGAFFAGLQGSIAGQETIVYASAGTQTVNIPSLNGGAAFVGFTDAGAAISQIQIHFLNDIVSVDDVRYGRQSEQPPTTVPEPTSLLLLGTGAVGLVHRLRRQK